MDLIVNKTLSIVDQEQFARLSGDFNPIHLDSDAARRELFGEVVVHGVHLLLSTLDDFIADQKKTRKVLLKTIRVKFLSPALLNKEVICRMSYTDQTIKAEIRDSKGSLLTEISIEYSLFDDLFDEQKVNPDPFTFSLPCKRNIDSIGGLSGHSDLQLNESLCRKLFPALLDGICFTQVAEILAFTKIVGMECPGWNSLFSGINLFSSVQDLNRISYKVHSTIEKFSMVNLWVEGPTLTGKLETFFRPEPTSQPTIEEISRQIPRDSFKNLQALVIGGSRGIGETTAKIIAAGGGNVVITYNAGKKESERICQEIEASGFSCQGIRLSIDELGTGNNVLPAGGVNAIFYYPSPRILKSNTFDPELFNTFLHYYVRQFYKMIKLAQSVYNQKLIVFYPSTVSIDEKTQGLIEYIMAKVAGEYLCESLNAEDQSLNIIVERLPRLHTDQTMNLLNFPSEPTFNVLLPIIKKVNTAIS
jgi:hypothetical protein